MARIAVFILYAVLAFPQALNAQQDAEPSPIVGTWRIQQMTVNGEDLREAMQRRSREGLVAILADSTQPVSHIEQLEAQLRKSLREAENDIQSTRFTFNNNGTYSVLTRPEPINGTWQLAENNTRLIITTQDGTEAEMLVIEISAQVLRLRTERDRDDTEMRLVRSE